MGKRILVPICTSVVLTPSHPDPPLPRRDPTRTIQAVLGPITKGLCNATFFDVQHAEKFRYGRCTFPDQLVRTKSKPSSEDFGKDPRKVDPPHNPVGTVRWDGGKCVTELF